MADVIIQTIGENAGVHFGKLTADLEEKQAKLDRIKASVKQFAMTYVMDKKQFESDDDDRAQFEHVHQCQRFAAGLFKDGVLKPRLVRETSAYRKYAIELAMLLPQLLATAKGHAGH